jgi:hypothetical protein
MTTLIITIPDSEINGISTLIRARGGNVVLVDTQDEDLSVDELESLKRGLKEALLIKEGKIKSIPFPEFWND